MFAAVIKFIGLNINSILLKSALVSKSVCNLFQECIVRSAIKNINSNEPLSYPCSIFINKCSGICNNINDPYTKLCAVMLLKA